MSEREKAILRMNDGTLLKGYLRDFSPSMSSVSLEKEPTSDLIAVSIEDAKAIFFVKSFEGDNEYRERKSYGISKPTGQKVYIKFKDGESMVGYLEGDVPWEKGFFLSRHDRSVKGFYLRPVDEDANNTKVFVVASSVKDATVMPGA